MKFTYCLLDKEVISAWEIQCWVGKSFVTSSENWEVAVLARFSYQCYFCAKCLVIMT